MSGSAAVLVHHQSAHEALVRQLLCVSNSPGKTMGTEKCRRGDTESASLFEIGTPREMSSSARGPASPLSRDSTSHPSLRSQEKWRMWTLRDPCDSCRAKP